METYLLLVAVQAEDGHRSGLQQTCPTVGSGMHGDTIMVSIAPHPFRRGRMCIHPNNSSRTSACHADMENRRDCVCRDVVVVPLNGMPAMALLCHRFICRAVHTSATKRYLFTLALTRLRVWCTDWAVSSMWTVSCKGSIAESLTCC